MDDGFVLKVLGHHFGDELHQVAREYRDRFPHVVQACISRIRFDSLTAERLPRILRTAHNVHNASDAVLVLNNLGSQLDLWYSLDSFSCNRYPEIKCNASKIVIPPPAIRAEK